MQQKIKNIILISVFVFVGNATTLCDKFVIGGRADCGFFSNFLGVLNNLHWCEKTNQIPVVYWPKAGLYYDIRGCNGIISDNIWDYYFYPVSALEYNSQDKINFSPFPPDSFCVATHPNTSAPYPDKYWRNYMNNFIKKYIRIKETTLAKIEKFYKENIEGKYTISIHIRGTDKFVEVNPVALDHIFETANKYVPCQFLVATDDERILNEAKKKLKGNMIYYNSCRVNRVTGVHNNLHSCAYQSRAYLGEEALIDCILLSRCSRLIHTWSNLSIAALLFNPELEHTHLEA
jgi:hypothetical protein